MSLKPSSEDAFYENLTLGLMKTLNSMPRITNVQLEKRQPCERAQLATWEQRHNVSLPDDMKRFYLSTDGFNLYWSYQYSPNDTRRVGSICFPHLLQVTLLRELPEALISQPSASTPALLHSPRNMRPSKPNGPNLTARSKIFELSYICDMAKVCLVYEAPDSQNPKIYLLELDPFKWQFLADTFTDYLRMSIVHLGLPYWELCFATCGLPSWTEQLFLLLAPHLLEKSEPRRTHQSGASETSAALSNQLDPTVFRVVKPTTTSKCNRQKVTK